MVPSVEAPTWPQGVGLFQARALWSLRGRSVAAAVIGRYTVRRGAPSSRRISTGNRHCRKLIVSSGRRASGHTLGAQKPYPAYLREHSPDYGAYRGKPRFADVATAGRSHEDAEVVATRGAGRPRAAASATSRPDS